jgi:hypothetical protein
VVFVDQTAKNRPTRDLFIVEVHHAVGRSWRTKFAGAGRPSTVVMPTVVREHHTHVPLTGDQYTVGEFGSDRAHEPFSETARPRTPLRNLDDADADISQDSIDGRGELTGPISDEEPELGDAIAKIHHQSAGLLRRPPTIRVAGRAQQVHRPTADLQHEQHTDPLERHHAVHREKVARQHRRCLRAQKLPRGRVGAPDRRAQAL